MGRCRFFYVKCSCGKYACTAVGHSEKLISKDQFPICHSDDHATECLRFGEGVKWHKELLEAKMNEGKR